MRQETYRKLHWVDLLALIIMIVGGLNWLLVGLFRYDVVWSIFGDSVPFFARLIYVLVGLASLYTIFRSPYMAHLRAERLEEAPHTP